MTAHAVSLVVVAGFVVVAAVIDVKVHRIPNRLVLAGIACGFALQGWLDGGAGLLTAAEGAAVGFAALFPLYLLRAMGAGDVKLMAMVGAFLGPAGTLAAALLAFVAGGVLAVATAAAKGALGRLFGNLRAMLQVSVAWVLAGNRPAVAAPATSVGNLPYGVAIAAGTLVQVAMTWTGVAFL